MIFDDDDDKNVDDDDNAVVRSTSKAMRRSCRRIAFRNMYTNALYSRRSTPSSYAASVYHVSLCFIILNGITIFDVILDFFIFKLRLIRI